MEKKQSLTYGTLVLTASSLFNRVLGFVYQILLVRLIRAEGIGLFSMVYPLYVMVLVLGSAGIPVAVAKLVAEETARNNYRSAYRIFRISFIMITCCSLLLTVVAAVLTPRVLEPLFPNPDVTLAFTALLPGIFIVSVCSAFRGYFQGLQQMMPTAVTQAVEQAVRVVAGLVLALILSSRGVAYATAGASAGVVIGEAAGLLLMTAIFLRYRPAVAVRRGAVTEALGHTCRRILSLAVPVTLTRFASTALLSIDAVLIPKRLVAAGLELTEATAAYGKLVGMAETLLFTPGMITIALATALLPAVSDAKAQGNPVLLQNRVSSAIRITLFIGMPSAVVLFLLADHICGILFGYPDAGVLLATLALGAPFVYLAQTTTGILQGLGRVMDPFKNLMIASVLKITGLYVLTGSPLLGAKGAAIALAMYFVILALLNLRDVHRHTGFTLEIRHSVVKPVFASTAMALVILGIGPALDSIWTTVYALVAGVGAYGITLVMVKGLTPEEVSRMRAIAGRIGTGLRP
ncbi:MAG: stage V sporulation protein B [Clostridia bacterium]|nr:stage V sporulation protein B [Clostridia bacterium]MDQ7791712.1 stage V sporulation protein B [Clostridia bacterium]